MLVAERIRNFHGTHYPCKMITILLQVCLIFMLTPGNVTGSDTGSLSCRSLRLEGPSMPTLRVLMGGVYTKQDIDHNNRPVFTRHLANGTSFIYYDTELLGWIIGPNLKGGDVALYIGSHVSDPSEANGTWYANVRGLFLPFEGGALSCFNNSKHELLKESSCRSVILSGPNIASQMAIMGAVFEQTNETHDGRSIFKFGTESEFELLFYYAQDSAWLIASEIPKGETFYYRLYALGTSNHPVDVKGWWWYATNGTFRHIDSMTVVCSKELQKQSTCRRILLRGPYVQLNVQAPILGAVFMQTSERHNGKRTFKFGSEKHFYFVFYNARSLSWIISLQMSLSYPYVYMFARSTADHPADVRGIWWYLDTNKTLQSYDGVSVDCVAGVLQHNNCSDVTLQGPYFKLADAIVGAVYRKINKTIDGRPVFKFGQEPYQTYIFYRRRFFSWFISNVTNDSSSTFYAQSTASHPADIDTMWWTYGRALQTLEARNISVACSEVRHSTSDSCEVLHLVNGPGTPLLIKIDAILNERFVYRGLGHHARPMYLFYKAEMRRWLLGYSLASNDNVIGYSMSQAIKPEKISGVWFFSLNKTWIPLTKAYIKCNEELKANCTAVRFTGIHNLHLQGISSKVYTHIYRDAHGRPVFSANGDSLSDTVSYIFYGFDKDKTGYWCVGTGSMSLGPRTLHVNVTIASISKEKHPVDIKRPWVIVKNGNFKGRYTEARIYCATESDRERESRQSDRITVIAAVASIVVLVLITFIVVLYLWMKKRYLLSDLLHPYRELEDAQFDVFICYKSGGPGQKLVLDYLLPVIERDWGLKVAIDTPHYIPGCEIEEAEESLRSLENSRRIILVLTFDFIDCHWCNIKCASARVQREKRLASVVPILFDDVSQSTNQSRVLKNILKISRCIPVPSEYKRHEAEQFWRALRKTLPQESNTIPMAYHRMDDFSEASVLEGPLVAAMRRELQGDTSVETQLHHNAVTPSDGSYSRSYSRDSTV